MAGKGDTVGEPAPVKPLSTGWRLLRRTLGALAAGAGVLAAATAFGWVTASGALLAFLVLGAFLIWTAAAHARDVRHAEREAASRLRARLSAYLARPDRLGLIDGVADPLLMVTPDGTIAEANGPARRLFGPKLNGRALALHVRHPKVLEAVEEAVEFDIGAQMEIALPGRGETERHFAVSVLRTRTDAMDVPLITVSRAPFFVVLTFHDITQTKVSERMRVDFVANASHELRTPLSSLIGFIETLKSVGAKDPEASARFLEIMQREADRMVRLIDDLLSLSRIEMDRHVQPRGQVELPGLLDGVLPSLAPIAEARNVRLTVTPPTAPLPAVRGDRDQLVQVVSNLVTNAIKYGAADSEVRLEMEPVRRIPEVGHPGVCLRVIDRGEGIAPDHLPRLTERFYQVDGARSRRKGGTGLGLSIVKHIVSRHRGHLHIDSMLGQGTTVLVYLPLAEPPPADPVSEDRSGALV